MKALVLGATGLVGEAVVSELCQRDEISTINVITRRHTDPFSKDIYSKVNHFQGDLESLDQLKEAFECDVVFCCLGTTMSKAGSKDAFRKVDHDYPLKAAKLFLEVSKNGHYLIITAMGSDKDSSIFYNKVKGQVEEDLKELNLKRLTILRPSLILGDRAEGRFLENVGQRITSFLNPFLSVVTPNYAPISYLAIANTMVDAAISLKADSDFRIILSGEMKK